MLRDGEILHFSKLIVEGESTVPICLLDDLVYSRWPHTMKEFANGEKLKKNRFMVTDCYLTGWLESVHLKDLGYLYLPKKGNGY